MFKGVGDIQPKERRSSPQTAGVAPGIIVGTVANPFDGSPYHGIVEIAIIDQLPAVGREKPYQRMRRIEMIANFRPAMAIPSRLVPHFGKILFRDDRIRMVCA